MLGEEEFQGCKVNELGFEHLDFKVAAEYLCVNVQNTNGNVNCGPGKVSDIIDQPVTVDSMAVGEVPPENGSLSRVNPKDHLFSGGWCQRN